MTAIDRRLFKERIFTGVPTCVTPAIRRLAHEVSPDRQPIYVRCEPDGDPSECYFNVARRVERDGGSILHGWTIWEWHPVLVEAEHHAVWLHGDVPIDVTPHPPANDRRILFVPDPDRRYDLVAMRRVDNVRRSLGSVPDAVALIEASASLARFIESCSVGRHVTMDPARYSAYANAFEQARGRVVEHLARRTAPHAPCICRSGKKFKKCCAPFIHLSS